MYDLETKPLSAYIWGLGKQVVRHGQLVKGHDQPGIICATYCWLHDDAPAESIDWGYEEQDTVRVVKHMDEIIKSADHVIGKNSDSFDNRVLNACRMLAGLPGMPEWIRSTDDLERQMRRHFRLPSHSLDYISGQLGFGGKIKMEFQDWIDIVEKTENGRTALEKMIKYGKKDVEDTRALWHKMSEHFEPRFNHAAFDNNRLACTRCGSLDLKRNGTQMSGGTKYQKYMCKTCGHYAGRCPISKVKLLEGKIRINS